MPWGCQIRLGIKLRLGCAGGHPERAQDVYGLAVHGTRLRRASRLELDAGPRVEGVFQDLTKVVQR